MGEIGQRLDVEDVHHGFGGRFDEQRLGVGVLCQRPFHCGDIGEVDEVELDAVTVLVHVVKQPVGAAV